MLNLKKLNSGLGYAFNTKSNNARQHSRLIAQTIWSYTEDITPSSTAIWNSRGDFINTFLNESGNLQRYLPRALKKALPIYANELALGIAGGFTGVPPSAPLPDFQKIMDKSRDGEATSNEAAAVLSTEIHNWFSTGKAVNNASGATTKWGIPGQAVVAPEPITDFSLSPADLTGFLMALETSTKLQKIQQAIVDNTIEDEEKEDREYVLLTATENVGKESEIVNEKESLSVDVNLSQDKIDKKLEDSIFSTDLGERIVEIAKADIGIAETGYEGNPGDEGLNYGGYKHPTNPDDNGTMPQIVIGKAKSNAGRIDAMHINGGIHDNWAQARYNGNVGAPWCASAVATWWDEAGASTPKFYKGVTGKYNKASPYKETEHPLTGREIPAGGMWRPAYCKSWREWAKTNGLWSQTPQVGAAIIFNSSASHIGIVAAIEANGNIVSIEGNTSKKGYNRNGIFCATKIINKSRVNGYIIPVPKGTLPNSSGGSGSDPHST